MESKTRGSATPVRGSPFFPVEPVASGNAVASTANHDDPQRARLVEALQTLRKGINRMSRIMSALEEAQSLQMRLEKWLLALLGLMPLRRSGEPYTPRRIRPRRKTAASAALTSFQSDVREDGCRVFHVNGVCEFTLPDLLAELLYFLSKDHGRWKSSLEITTWLKKALGRTLAPGALNQAIYRLRNELVELNVDPGVIQWKARRGRRLAMPQPPIGPSTNDRAA